MALTHIISKFSFFTDFERCFVEVLKTGENLLDDKTVTQQTLLFHLPKNVMYFKLQLSEYIGSTIQARNQDFFRAGEFSWNQGTLISNDVQHEKKILSRRENSPISFLETLKNGILNEKFNPQMATTRAFLPKIRALFSNF